MMRIQRTLVAFLAVMFALPTFAKISIFDKDERVYYGVRLGLSMAKISSDSPELDGDRSSTGLNFGVVAGLNLSEDYPVILEGALLYVEKGGERNYKNSKTTYDLNYLQVPIVVKYKFKAGDDFSVAPFAGGYLSLGISGKVKDYETKKSWSSYGSNGFQRFDGGLRLGCGAEYQMLYIEAGYDFGISNISHSDFEASRTGSFFINAGVNF